MQSESSNVQRNASTQQVTPGSSSTSQHGQLRNDDQQDSLQPHSGELRGDLDSPPRGENHLATRLTTEFDDATAGTPGLSGSGAATPSARNRISEYENARTKSPKKPADGPLFEIIKSSKRLDDKTSAIGKLPNGKSRPFFSNRTHHAHLLTICRGPDPCHCPPFAQ